MKNFIGNDSVDTITLQDKQHGFVGITIFLFGFVPSTNAEKDWVATQRVRDFYVGW